MESLLPGLHHAPNAHPAFVHYPIALWLTALLFAAAGAVRARDDLVRVSRWLLYLGTAGALLAATTGWNAMLELEDMPGHDLIHVHMNWMFWAVGIGVASCVLGWVLARRIPTSASRWTFALALVAVVGVTTIGADRGAHLVYRYGIGTQQETPPPGHEEHGGHGRDAGGSGGGHEHHDER